MHGLLMMCAASHWSTQSILCSGSDFTLCTDVLCIMRTLPHPIPTEYVVAIDLGTSCTAYSSKTATDPNPSVGVPDMEPGEDIIGKSPTTLLVAGSTGPDKVFKPSGAEAFGRVAQRRYVENDIPHGAQIFKRFKMVREMPHTRRGSLLARR